MLPGPQHPAFFHSTVSSPNLHLRINSHLEGGTKLGVACLMGTMGIVEAGNRLQEELLYWQVKAIFRGAVLSTSY